jgi:tetratricopeptide (TPR) repeat protein
VPAHGGRRVLNFLADVVCRDGRVVDALRCFGESAADETVNDRLGRADLLWAMAEHDGARAAFEEVLAENPGPGALFELGRFAELREGDRPKAADCYRRAAHYRPRC